jgi:hypothetical protein
MRKYRGSTSGVGTSTAAVQATNPAIQYTPWVLPTPAFIRNVVPPSHGKGRTDFPEPCPSAHQIPRRQRVPHHRMKLEHPAPDVEEVMAVVGEQEGVFDSARWVRLAVFEEV